MGSSVSTPATIAVTTNGLIGEAGLIGEGGKTELIGEGGKTELIGEGGKTVTPNYTTMMMSLVATAVAAVASFLYKSTSP